MNIFLKRLILKKKSADDNKVCKITHHAKSYTKTTAEIPLLCDTKELVL